MRQKSDAWCGPAPVEVIAIRLPVDLLEAAFAERNPRLLCGPNAAVQWRGSHVIAAVVAGIDPRTIERALCVGMTRREAKLMIRAAKAMVSQAAVLGAIFQTRS